VIIVATFEAPTVVAGLDDVAVMGQAVAYPPPIAACRLRRCSALGPHGQRALGSRISLIPHGPGGAKRPGPVAQRIEGIQFLRKRAAAQIDAPHDLAVEDVGDVGRWPVVASRVSLRHPLTHSFLDGYALWPRVSRTSSYFCWCQLSTLDEVNRHAVGIRQREYRLVRRAECRRVSTSLLNKTSSY
jgi:hypothetical protein